MIQRYAKIGILLSVCLLFIAPHCKAYKEFGEKQMHVTMRMIGHQLLLCVNDHTSRILPIENEDDRYKIEFSSDFEFNPDDLIPIIGENLVKVGIDKNYLVEVVECNTKNVVYSYKVGETPHDNMMPCSGRSQPKACYKLFITLLKDSPGLNVNAGLNLDALSGDSRNGQGGKDVKNNYAKLSLVGLPALLLLGLLFVIFKRKEKVPANSNLISVGNTYFDEHNMLLTLGDQITELTSKEADLLSLLVNHSNSTVEREEILKSVWGDEGDYVGRTLDVFISKLRKKLEADSSVKIINIRGVGYKLVLN